MIPEKSLLSPSIELNTIRTDRFKTESLSVTVCLPLERAKAPLYSLVLSTLKRGTEKYPTQGHINRRLDELYAAGVSLRFDRVGNNYIFGFSAEMLDGSYTDGKTDIFEGTIDVILQMLFHPLTDEKGNLLSRFVEREKEIACDLIESTINNPKTYAGVRCREIMFEGDDYGTTLLETVECIDAATAESLTALYKTLICDRKFNVFYIGSKSREDVGARISRALAPYIGEPKPYVADTTGCIGTKSRRVEEKTDVSQGKLVIGMRTGITVRDADFYAMLVMSELYGGSPVSKLFMNVRERLSLCYYCSAVYEIYKGSMFVSCGVDPENRDKAEAEIFRQLDDIRAGKITDAEFEAAVKSLINSYRALSDVPANLESYYSGRDLFGISCTVAECMDKIRSVTPADVVRVAQSVETDTVYFLWGDACGEEEDEEENE